MRASYLRVKNWREFQHYAKRRPPWIKLFNRILGDDTEFAELDELEQWQLVRIWLIASRSSRYTLDEERRIVPVVVNDEQSLRRAIQTLKKVPIEKFIRAGWLVPVAEEELVDEDGASTGASTTLASAPVFEPVFASDASALLDTEKQRYKELHAVSSAAPGEQHFDQVGERVAASLRSVGA